MQAKLKIFVSFYQVAITLKYFYGAQIHSDFISMFSFLEIFGFSLAELLSIPNSCYGSMKTRIYLSVGWLYALVLLLVGRIFSQTIIIDMRIKRSTKRGCNQMCVSITSCIDHHVKSRVAVSL